ncbi:DUF4097 family beta strand repeat-containing protein [Ornithinibacillus scapharcae]|uniref:DUF4097 family beta strand repeat-containing protein n=1 Tax=Ornithinibacillus scapharcae TaxID=1147159 RepID=UPI000225C0CC|nr:DUF4097 family beta strand repeat-containing protein [Ornithinibacillus scapharcae]
MGILKGLLNSSRKTIGQERSFEIRKLHDFNLSADIADVGIIVHDQPRIYISFETYENGPVLETIEKEDSFTISAKRESNGPTIVIGNIPKCRLDIYVPSDIATNWDIRVTSGRITAENLLAKTIRVSATSGSIKLSNVITERAELNTKSGKISVNKLNVDMLKFRALSGKVMIRSSYGDINGEVGSGEIAVSEIKGDDLTLSTGSGRINIKEVYYKNVTLEAGSGKISAESFWGEKTNARVGSGVIDFRDFQGSMKGNSYSGNIKISISENSSLDLKTGSGNINVEFQDFDIHSMFDVKTGSGGIVTNLPMQMETQKKHHMVGKVGHGDNLIRLRTGSGKVVMYTMKSN